MKKLRRVAVGIRAKGLILFVERWGVGVMRCLKGKGGKDGWAVELKQVARLEGRVEKAGQVHFEHI